MTSIPKQRPSVPGGWNVPVLGSRQVDMKAEGAKNHRVRCHGFYLATYNCRSLNTEARLEELEEELGNTKWDVIGLSEVRRKGEELLELKSGHLLYYRGTDNGQNSGIGFLINRRINKNVIEISSSSNRVGRLVLQLSKRYQVQIIQVYAPTISYSEDEVEEFYEEVQNISRGKKQHFKIIMGDFNARIGKREDNEAAVGNFGTGVRDERGHRLVEFATGENLYIMNSFFKKNPNRKWTWKSPSGRTSEIDYIMVNKKYVITDCTVLNRFNTGSDHRMVRCKVHVDVRLERQKLLQKPKFRVDTMNLRIKAQEFQIQLTNRYAALADNIEGDNLNELNTKITETLMETATQVAGLKSRHCAKKLSDKTKQLMEKRRTMKVNGNDKTATIEYTELCKTVRKCITADIRKYNCDLIQKVIEDNKSLKILKRNLCIGRKRILGLKTESGVVTKNPKHILKQAVKFYSNLYKAKETNYDKSKTKNEIPPVLKEEVRFAINKMKNGKASGEDGITVDILKEAGDDFITILTRLFNKCLKEQDVPEDWKNAIIILLFKKGEKEDIKNYRPISLLSVLYKILTKILTNRLQKSLDAAQPREQAGFRSGFSTTDHIHVIREVIERTNEYQLPLCMAFVDYEKAFDSVKTSAVINALENVGIDQGYISLIKNIYNEGTAKIRLHETSKKFKIGKGVRQGDTISPKLFNAVLQNVFKRLNWEQKGIKIDGEYLSHLRFADDIVVLASTAEELQNMIQELDLESRTVGLKMNLNKTKVMFNRLNQQKIKLGDTELETVNSYIYLGQRISINGDIMEEINHRVKLAWSAFGRNSMILKGNLPLCLKRKVFNQCILPVLTYASETWTLKSKEIQKLKTTQRSMERCMMGLTRRDRKRNEWVRSQTKVTDVIERIKRLKWKWAGHLMRRNDNRWTMKVVNWIPRGEKRPRKRPHARWRDEIKKFVGIDWVRKTANRKEWKVLGEAFILQWIDMG